MNKEAERHDKLSDDIIKRRENIQKLCGLKMFDKSNLDFSIYDHVPEAVDELNDLEKAFNTKTSALNEELLDYVESICRSYTKNMDELRKGIAAVSRKYGLHT